MASRDDVLNPPKPPKIITEVAHLFRTVADAGHVLDIPNERLRAWQRNGYRNDDLCMVMFGLEEHIDACESLRDELKLVMRRNRRKRGFKYPPEK